MTTFTKMNSTSKYFKQINMDDFLRDCTRVYFEEGDVVVDEINPDNYVYFKVNPSVYEVNNETNFLDEVDPRLVQTVDSYLKDLFSKKDKGRTFRKRFGNGFENDSANGSCSVHAVTNNQMSEVNIHKSVQTDHYRWCFHEPEGLISEFNDLEESIELSDFIIENDSELKISSVSGTLTVGIKKKVLASINNENVFEIIPIQNDIKQLKFLKPEQVSTENSESDTVETLNYNTKNGNHLNNICEQFVPNTADFKTYSRKLVVGNGLNINSNGIGEHSFNYPGIENHVESGNSQNGRCSVGQ